VLITGDPAAGKTLLFRALAGLWPWGKGRIGLPKGEAITFIPRTPYFMPGTLRSALAAPDDDKKHSEKSMKDALETVGLGRLSHRLDQDARWDRELSEEEQRLLAFARLALHKPDWIIIDEALDTLDASARQGVIAMFEERLARATIVNVGRHLKTTKFFTRELHLTKDCEGRKLKPVDLLGRPLAKRIAA